MGDSYKNILKLAIFNPKLTIRPTLQHRDQNYSVQMQRQSEQLPQIGKRRIGTNVPRMFCCKKKRRDYSESWPEALAALICFSSFCLGEEK
ncbi:hypothetical protein [Aquamicrobium sp. LC103]|uniref:hypothetical protein n=1 Tax=Aquamicrobium sp. LC103 TaxID=1120658 RepID=UPI00109C4C83|nr:hypothetical protein [Aquamicrobium sp. LC103]TKT77436.1 hypothetical protein XW59_013260 [Aquamicrobium sp. LC103]